MPGTEAHDFLQNRLLISHNTPRSESGRSIDRGRGVNEFIQGARRATLTKMLVVLAMFVSALAFVLILTMTGVVRDRAVRDLARDDARQTSQLVFQSLYSAMRKGWNKDEIREIVERLNSSMPGLKIRVFRGQIVAHQFGEMPGEHDIIAADPLLTSALQDGKEALVVAEEGKTIRYLYPVQAKEECLVCHTQSHVGAVHGVIDITYPVGDVKVSFSYVVNAVVGFSLLILALMFAILFL
jgi:hypothetical protein